MKRRSICLLLCLVLLGSILAVPVSATFVVTYYNETIYAGGILDLYAFVGEEDLSGYTFQWQFDGSLGDGSWYDLTENEHYKGVKTNHLQFYTDAENDYTDWENIPFRCVIKKGSTTKYTPNIYMHIYPYSSMEKALKNWDFGLYEPTVTNTTDFSTTDYVNYTANAYAGANLEIFCGGNTATQKTILANSEVELRREIRISENNKYVVSGDRTTYIPYTISDKAVKIDINMRVVMAGVDKGVVDTKTIYINTKKPESIARGVTNGACSMLRYPYNESEKLDTLPANAVVQVVGKVGGFYQVYVRSVVSFIPEGMLRVDAPAQDTVIKNLELTIEEPVAGKTPATTCQVGTVGCELYKTDPITWIDKATGKAMKPGEKFQEGRSYDLSIWVAAKEGYKFQTDASGKPKLTGTINGNRPPYINKAYEQDPEKVVELTYTFSNVPKAEEEPTHAHTPSGWRTTQVYHYKVCTTCGDFLEQEDHKGGVATCQEQGICTVCGYAYLNENENHTPDTSKWVARGSMYHFYPCKDCGAHCDIEDHRWSPTYLYQDKTGHAWICADCKAHSEIEPHVPGPEATQTTPQTCKECDFVIEPAKNHKHDLTRVPETPATCMEGGNIEYYFCTGCNDCFTDPEGKNKLSESVSVLVDPLGHTVSDTWNHDELLHWRTCSTCGAVLDETKMIHDEQDGKCATCGYASGTKETDPRQEPTEPAGDQKPGDKESGGKDWITVLLVALVCFGAAITSTVIVLKMQKKRG